jgi:hypothetical protein
MVAAWATLETSEEAPHTLCFPITREDAQLQRRFGSESPGFVRAPKLLSIRARLVVHRRGQWQSFEAVDFATLIWVDWFNHRRLLEPIGNIRRPKPRSLLRDAGRAGHRGLTQTKRPPETWARSKAPNVINRSGLSCQTLTVRERLWRAPDFGLASQPAKNLTAFNVRATRAPHLRLA